MVAGEQQPEVRRPQPYQREPQQRTTGIERPGVVGGQHPIELGRVGGHLLPRQVDLARNQLYRRVEALVVEPRGQVRVPPQQRVRRLPQPLRLQRPGHLVHQLDDVDIHGPRVVQRVEQETLLQR
ncbi:hypothetical protein Lesp02_06940 [Lentzea sp. NBRC 105346]|nr:hypothetical protein Lesp02_06940 [Lentzea sp. NBRC 105346]